MDLFEHYEFDPLETEVPSYPFFELWGIAWEAREMLVGLTKQEVISIGYPATFRPCLNPIGGEYLEIPSTTGIHNHRYRHEQKGGAVGLMAFELIKKQRVGLLISFSVEVANG